MNEKQHIVCEPSVCVIIAAYNAAGTIGRAVRSALAESEVAEVVVVDDASTDSTAEYARSYDDGSGRLKVLVQKENGGPSAARNRAIRESTAPWIAILDADDFFLPGRIQKLLAYARHADLVADDIWQVPEYNIDGPRKSLLGKALTEPKTIDFTAFVLSNVTRRGRNRCELGFIKPLIRRRFLTYHGISYKEYMRLGEDFELYARCLARNARMLLVPAQGYVSVMRSDSLSAQHSEIDLLHLRNCTRSIRENIPLTAVEQKALRRHYASVDCRLQWRHLISAVKNRDTDAIFTTFLRPYPVPLYLIGQLAEQAYIRTLQQFRRLVLKKPGTMSGSYRPKRNATLPAR